MQLKKTNLVSFVVVESVWLNIKKFTLEVRTIISMV